MLIALLTLCVLLPSSALGFAVVEVSASAEFANLTGPSAQYLWYVRAPNSTWDCTKTPGVCTSQCGTSSANGPQCANPSVPSQYTLDLDRFPTQVRWGNPVSISNGGTGVPSGFGFRGVTSAGLSDIHSVFWIGEAVHFNNVIKSGTAANSWKFIVKLSVLPYNKTEPVTADFSYILNLDETNNACSGDGCPWNSTWWASQNSGVDTRDDCPVNSSPHLPNNGPSCCRYITEKNKPCADKVWTLSPFDQTYPAINVSGVLYTLSISGFSYPGQPDSRKIYFISQEGNQTLASIYARLVTACPSLSDCPVGQSLVLDKTSTRCVCSCPSGDCPAGQYRDATCKCVCPDSTCKNGGTPYYQNNRCKCNCNTAYCPAGHVIVNPDNCECGCPPLWCGPDGIISDNDTCQCTCLKGCPAGQIIDEQCNCSCPSGAEADCVNRGGDWRSSTCDCNLPCSCLNNTCQTATGCDYKTGECIYEYHEFAACDGLDLCTGRCGANGSCNVAPVDCHAALLAEKGEIDAACYVVECNPSTGQCDPKFQAGAYCVPSSGANTCVPGICDPTTYKCEPAPLRDGSDCSTAQTLALTDTCNKGECWDGKCVLKPQTRSCDDYDACTKEDACDSYGKCVGNEVKCYPTNNCTNAYCDKQKGCVFEALPDGTTCGTSLTDCGNSVCISGVCTWSPCNATARSNEAAGSGSANKKGIYLGVGFGAAALLLGAAIAFFARKRLKKFLFPEHNAFNNGAAGGAGNNPAYQGPGSEGVNALHEPASTV